MLKVNTIEEVTLELVAIAHIVEGALSGLGIEKILLHGCTLWMLSSSSGVGEPLALESHS